MKILIIGGTGTISSAITRQLAESGHKLWLLNRGTRQYVYISSASAYNKPAASHVITEGTTLANPHWEYSRNKIACEELLLKEYRENGFPVTIVRPSHTYCERAVPGFQATTRFDEGVCRCVEHIMSHPELQVEDPEFDAWCDKVIEAQELVKQRFNG